MNSVVSIRLRARRLRVSLVCGVAVLSGSIMTLAEPIPAPEILQLLHRFREMGSVLYIAAHPDDENTELITCFARGRNYRTAYLSLTRAHAGQTMLCPEFLHLFAVIP